MSITVGQIRLGVLHEMREFSNSGSIQSGADVKDYELSVIPLLNTYVLELATTTHKLERKHEIAHNMPVNQLGLLTLNEEAFHSSTDVIYSAKGSRAYSFQVSKYATVYIEEEIAGVWTNLLTITHTPTDGEGYVTYKGLTNVSNTNNHVRIRFSGSYRYPYRWVALFAENFFNDSEVPMFEPFVPYNLPLDWFSLNRVEYTHADRQFGNYSAYKLDDKTSQKVLYINYFDKAEIICHYFAYPSAIPTPNPSNITASDNLTVDIADECAPALIHRICATLQRDENSYMSDVFLNDYQIAKAELVQNDSFDSNDNGIVLNANW